MAVGKKKIQHTDGVSSLVNQNNIKTEFQDLLSVIQSFKSQLSLMAGKVKNLEKSVNKKIKTLEKEAAKNRNKGNRKPSGFATPTKISNDLCKFMNKPSNSEAARTEVTKYIISYIKENNLQSMDNKRIIQPDSALHLLLKPDKKDKITFFNIQRYMNKHFLKQ
jgi:chromatin remodeling complex protein RSC6